MEQDRVGAGWAPAQPHPTPNGAACAILLLNGPTIHPRAGCLQVLEGVSLLAELHYMVSATQPGPPTLWPSPLPLCFPAGPGWHCIYPMSMVPSHSRASCETTGQSRHQCGEED